MNTLLQAGLLGLQFITTFIVSYLLLLTFAAWRAPKHTQSARANQKRHKFLILIPAHNEEKLLPRLLVNLQALAYPKEAYSVHVIADNCVDKTAEFATQHGAIAHERQDDHKKGKGYALQWMLEKLWQDNVAHDAVVILDADTIVSENFLDVMNARLNNGERVIQSYYAVQNPESSFSAGLRYAALAVLHYLRPQGRMVLGGSAGLKGNGMVFAADIMRNQTWSDSVTEDIELHMTLLLSGERVTFAPDAVIQAEMPDKLTDARSQNVRWEQGRLQMAKKYIPQLFTAVLRKANHPKKAFVLLDAIMEHLIPPFSVLAGLSVVSLLGSLLWWFTEARTLGSQPSTLGASGTTFNLSLYSLILSLGVLLGQVVYLLAGLKMVNAPRSVYRVFIYAPWYILWKIWHYVRILFGFKQQTWVRTTRNEG
ncbi:MAG: glycosyltransferase family 2 protein [Candidatus Promineifilaceae bacterium]|nr:glycosyltransferase family 2 protein [Anaerolineaceae bacterium]